MFIGFSTATDDGQFGESFAVEVREANISGMNKEGFHFDIVHLDGEKERLILGGIPYDGLSMGKLANRIMNIRFTDLYPAVKLISKAEFRARVGVGKILGAKGYYEPAATS